jgi:hypothetical protein
MLLQKPKAQSVSQLARKILSLLERDQLLLAITIENSIETRRRFRQELPLQRLL